MGVDGETGLAEEANENDAGAAVSCFFCHRQLDNLTLLERQLHLNRCLDGQNMHKNFSKILLHVWDV